MKTKSIGIAAAAIIAAVSAHAQLKDAYWTSGNGNEGSHISDASIYGLPSGTNMAEYKAILDAFKAPPNQNFLRGPQGDFTVGALLIADNWTDSVPNQFNKGNFWLGDSGGKINALGDFVINSSFYMRSGGGSLVEINVGKNFVIENKWNNKNTLTVMWGETGYGYGMTDMGPKSLKIGGNAAVIGNVYWTMYLPNIGRAWKASEAPITVAGVLELKTTANGTPRIVLNNNENLAARHMFVSLGGLDGKGEIYNRSAVAHDPGGNSKTTIVFTNKDGLVADFQGGLASNRFYANANATTSPNVAELNVVMNGKGEQILRTNLLVDGQPDKAPWRGDILVNKGTLKVAVNYASANPERDFSRLNITVNEDGKFGAAAATKPADKTEDIGRATVSNLDLYDGAITVNSHKSLGNSSVHVYGAIGVIDGFKIDVFGYGKSGTVLKGVLTWEKLNDSVNRTAIADAIATNAVKLYVNGRPHAIAATNNADGQSLDITIGKAL